MQPCRTGLWSLSCDHRRNRSHARHAVSPTSGDPPRFRRRGLGRWEGAGVDVSNPTNDFRHLFDVQTEELILGAILTQGNRALDHAHRLEIQDFTVIPHQKIFAAILYLNGEVEIGIDSVSYRLDELGQLENIGGLSKLLDLSRPAVPLTGTYIERYVAKLRAKTRGRSAARLTSTLNGLLQAGSGIDDDDVGGLLDELRGLRESGSNGGDLVEALPNPGDTEQPVSYIIKPELPERSVIGITGPSGEGKSSLATAWSREAIAAGRPVLILDRENPRSVVVDRMKRLGMSDNPLLRWWGGWARLEAAEPGAACVRDWVKACIARGLLPLVIVDSLAAFNVGDENSAADMRRFMHQCRRLADLGATVIVIHHDGKAETSKDFRGSSDFKASVDQAFHCSNLGSDGKLDRLTLRCFKSRFGLGGSLIYRYAGGRFLRDERPDAPARSIADRLTALLRQNPGIGARKFEEAAAKQDLGRQRARDFLANGVLGGLIRREDAGRNRFKHYLQEGR
jgi:hypothetical protein